MQAASLLPKPSGTNVKPGQNQGGKASFVICEICDGWIKDLDQLRNHMQWMHKVKVRACVRTTRGNPYLQLDTNSHTVQLLLLDTPENDLQSATIELPKMPISVFHRSRA